MAARRRGENVVAACSPCNLRKGGMMPAVAHMWPRQKPIMPTVQDLHNNGRLFPPNHLHDSGSIFSIGMSNWNPNPYSCFPLFAKAP